MSNQASEDELYERIERLFDLRISSSGADIGIGFKTSRERSGSDRTWVDYEEWLELRQSIESLIRTEKLKLLAEVREQAQSMPIHGGTDSCSPSKYVQAVSIDALTKLEAEL